MFASDVHGSAYYCRKMLEAYDKEKAERLVLLGDLLYHGPRNDLPKEYAPKEVIRLLNERKNQIYAVRGNCEAEVDQMVLDFPVMADYCILAIDGKTLYATHGHIYNKDNLPPMMDGDILIHGHTHVLKAEQKEGYILLNPGSVSIPKEGNPPTYAVLEDKTFTIKDFDGNIIQKQTPDVDYTGFDDRNRPNTGFAVAWAYKNHPNVYSFFTDTIYAAFDDTIRPRYFLSLGKYKRPLQLKVSAEWKNYIIFHRFWETKDCLLGSFGLEQKAWFFRYDKKSKEIKTWKQEAKPWDNLPGFEWIIRSAPGITNDIDGCSDHLRKMDYISENQFAICITQDNMDEIRKIVSESTNVKFPEKRQQLLDMIDSMGPDDNPILAIYKLKD